MQEQAIQEIQILEQNLQQLLLQKQAFQMDLSETQSASKEIKKSGDEVFKIVGQLMIKTEKNKIIDELESKEKILNLRLKSIEKQEKQFTDRANEVRDELINSAKK